MPIDIRAQQGLTPPESPIEGLGKIFALKNMQQEQHIRQAQLGLHQQEFQQKQQQYQDQQDAQRVLDAALQQATTRDQIRDYFTSRGKGHLWLPVSKSLDAADEAKAKVDHLKAQIGELQDKHTLARQEWWASQATGLQKLDPEDWPAAIPRVLASAVHSGIEDENTVRQMWGRALENPEEIPKLINHLAASSHEALKSENMKPVLVQTTDAAGNPVQRFETPTPGKELPVGPKTATAEGNKERRRQIDVNEAMGQPVSPQEKEWAKAFDKTEQNKLEQQYRQVLRLPLSNRSGGLGLEDSKVNQAIHLMNIFDSSYNPKTKEYDIPAVMQEELALGLARLVSPNGQVGVELAERMNQPTAYGKMQALLSFVTGKPQTGSTQAVFKMFKDSIERQGAVAESNRDQYMDYIRTLVPTELDEERRGKIESGVLNSFVNRKPVNPEAMKTAKTTGATGKMVPMVAKDAQGNYTRKLLVPEDEVSAAEKAGAKRQ